ncbi:hypothetical protein IAD21_05381 [Abditibacteriota bacterium]|nr:hypothetical protein IAD21_05381 [Abditibacteriota bacterium]
MRLQIDTSNGIVVGGFWTNRQPLLPCNPKVYFPRRVNNSCTEGAELKNCVGKTLSNAETFQWINLLHGDTMFMSLTNHRYLATTPNAPGQVTAITTGPTPARKGGECFKFTVL